MRSPALLFGIPIEDVTMDECVTLVGRLVAVGRATSSTQQVATVNVDFLVNALLDHALHTNLRNASLCAADGAPVLWGARWLGTPLRERVAGVDLVSALAASSASNGLRIHLFGSREGSAERAAQLLRERHPGANVTGDSGPMVRDVRDTPESVLRSIEELDPDVLCVALGNPKQEQWIAAHRDRLRTPVMIGVGGTVDFLVGHRRRAPMWVQRIGLEWLVRAAQEPARLGRRYAKDAIVYFPRLARAAFAQRRWREGASITVDPPEAPADPVTVRAVRMGGLPAGAMPDGADGWFEHGSVLELQFSDEPLLDVAALAQVAGLARLARRWGREVRIDAPRGSMRDQLAQLGLG